MTLLALFYYNRSMARILAQHGIEQFVSFWISKFRNSNELRQEKRYVEKAIKQIEFFLNPPCCVDPEATIEFRRLDNDLTRFISAQIAQEAFDRRKWKKSLQRAINALKALLDGCCNIVNPDFTGVWDSPNSVDFSSMRTLTDDGTEQGLFSTTWGGFQGPTNVEGVLSHGNATDKLEVQYYAAIPSGLTVCVHLIQDGNEIAGSPFNIGIPGSGSGSFTIENLKGSISGTLPLQVLVDTGC